MIFVDTGAWFARFVADDADHARAAQWFSANDEPLVTSDYCIDETLTLLVMRRHPGLAVKACRLFFEERFAKVYFLTHEDLHTAAILFQQPAAAGLSFTDCTTKAAMDRLKIRSIVAFDRHFRDLGTLNVLP